jgi:hypothetical protein
MTRKHCSVMQSRDKRWASCVLAMLLLALPTSILADETAGENPAPAVSNIGLEKNPPDSLKKKFPMCDAFLKVQWISKQKQIGYSEYETPLRGRKGRSAGRRKVSVLVLMQEPFGPEVRYDVSFYRENGQLEKLFEAVRNGKVEGSEGHELDLLVQGKDDSFTVNFDSVELDGYRYSFAAEFSDYRQTVCVVYADGQRAWIVEGKRPAKMYDKAQLDALLGTLKASGAGMEKWRLENSWVLDVNQDGIPDYYCPEDPRSTYTYSVGRRYYSSSLVEGTGTPTNPLPTFSFPPRNGRCAVKAGGMYLTTDGKNYFINNRCNLTDLTTRAG